MNKFAKRVRELRIEKSMSQDALAKELSFTPTTVTKWESGEREPSFDVLIELADFFCVSTDYLLGRED